MIHLGVQMHEGICKPLKWPITSSELSDNMDVNTLAKSVYQDSSVRELTRIQNMTTYFHPLHVYLLKIVREYVDTTQRRVFAHE